MVNNKKIHRMSWKRMGRSKNEGGMGFKDLVVFNQVLLAKQCWRLYQSPSSLTARIFKAKYFSHSIVLEASLGTRPSFCMEEYSFLSFFDTRRFGIESG
jgi:hypothetical protein